jgi:ABC-type polysaccharide/polyol phosphate export permease
MSSIWGGFTQALWFATPIFYFVDQFSILSIFNLFNPLYYFISVSRDIIIYSTTPPLYMIGGVLGYTIVSLMLGHLIFNRVKNTFVEKM